VVVAALASKIHAAKHDWGANELPTNLGSVVSKGRRGWVSAYHLNSSGGGGGMNVIVVIANGVRVRVIELVIAAVTGYGRWDGPDEPPRHERR